MTSDLFKYLTLQGGLEPCLYKVQTFKKSIPTKNFKVSDLYVNIEGRVRFSVSHFIKYG